MPQVVRLVNELPDLDPPNKAIVAQLYAVGGLSHGRRRSRRANTRCSVRPAAPDNVAARGIDMPHGGALELRFSSYDEAFHMAYLPTDGGQQALELPVHEGGVARVRLDQPGLYWFGCPVADHVGRGMLGLIIVRAMRRNRRGSIGHPSHDPATERPHVPLALLSIGGIGVAAPDRLLQ